MAKEVIIRNARLSFPSLFKKGEFNGKQNDKFEATFLFPKTDTKTYDAVMASIEEVKKEGKLKVTDDKLCIKDGDFIDYDGYEGMWAVKASNGKRPPVFDRDLSIIAEEDEKVYAGCYVNAKIDFWGQNNSYGKRVNSNLLSVQFVKDGDSFEGSFVGTADDFDVIEDDDGY